MSTPEPDIIYSSLKLHIYSCPTSKLQEDCSFETYHFYLSYILLNLGMKKRHPLRTKNLFAIFGGLEIRFLGPASYQVLLIPAYFRV
jgi:hypothetical protein